MDYSKDKIAEALPFILDQIEVSDNDDPMYLCNALHWALITYWPAESDRGFPIVIPNYYYDLYMNDFQEEVKLNNYAFYCGMGMLELDVDEASPYHVENLTTNSFFVLGKNAKENKDEFYSSTYNAIVEARADMSMLQ